ncbi:MAG: ATP-binding cassette domain-containing protein [Bdellovibrionales bacterium]|nr:ATP-binding cassette domain-containing protein [Bdellovibrionales bacterium]
MIHVEHLSKSFRVFQKDPGFRGSLRSLFKRKWIEKHALKDLNLHVGPGEIVGLVGANGAGKTTAVKMLAGIIHPTSGTANVLGHTPWQRKNAFRREIALLMGQKAQLWWDLPAGDCFELLRDIYSLPEAEFRKTLGSLTAMLGVEGQLRTQIRRLSLGERMKMEIIAALLHQPKVVFLDEPTIGLDLTAQRAVRKFLLEYRASHRPAMILTSHYMEDIEQLCERIVILREGEKVFDGPLADIQRAHSVRKVVIARLGEPAAGSEAAWERFELPAAWASAVRRTAEEVRYSVDRGRVAEAASRMLQGMPVADLSIEEEDISNLIEALLHRRPQ